VVVEVVALFFGVEVDFGVVVVVAFGVVVLLVELFLEVVVFLVDEVLFLVELDFSAAFTMQRERLTDNNIDVINFIT